MAAVPFIIERRVQYHGLWNAGYTIGDLFFKNLSKEFGAKPPYPALLRLSVSSIALQLFRRGTPQPQEVRTDTIPFEALRDVTANPFNPRCLMVVYVNNKNKFSVLACSCRDHKETSDVAAAFQKLRSIRESLRSQNTKANWIMRKIDATGSDGKDGATADDTNNGTNLDGRSATSNIDPEVASIKSRTDSRVLAENFEFLDHESDFDEGSVFGDDTPVDREQGPGENSASVGLQTDIHMRPNRVSVSSTSSLASMQGLKDEINSIAKDWTTPTTQDTPTSTSQDTPITKSQDTPTLIAQVEYWKVNNSNYSGEDSANGTPTRTRVILTSHLNGTAGDDVTDEAPKSVPAGTYDYRSLGTQTDLGQASPPRIRYTKRPGSMGSFNSYKALKEQRLQKLNNSNSNNNNTNNTNNSNGNSNVTQENGLSYTPPTGVFVPTNYVRQRPASYHFGGPQFQPIRPPAPIVNSSSTTVTRPIEQVYKNNNNNNSPGNSWGRRGQGQARKRRVLVVGSGRHTLRI